MRLDPKQIWGRNRADLYVFFFGGGGGEGYSKGQHCMGYIHGKCRLDFLGDDGRRR